MVILSLFLVRKSIRGVYPPPHRLRFIRGCSDLICRTTSPGIAAHLPNGEKSIRIYYIHAYFSLRKVIHYVSEKPLYIYTNSVTWRHMCDRCDMWQVTPTQQWGQLLICVYTIYGSKFLRLVRTLATDLARCTHDFNRGPSIWPAELALRPLPKWCAHLKE